MQLFDWPVASESLRKKMVQKTENAVNSIYLSMDCCYLPGSNETEGGNMSDAEAEAMDGPAASGEESERKAEKPSSSPEKSYLFGAGEIIEGKRATKSVKRLDYQGPKMPVKLSIADGCGEKLGDIPRILHKLNKMKPVDLVPLHSLLFDRRGKLSQIKKNLRLFSGFPFDADSEQFTKKREKLQKNTNTKLKLVCEVLDLEKKGTHSDLVDRIMTFLVSPKSSGKVKCLAGHGRLMRRAGRGRLMGCLHWLERTAKERSRAAVEAPEEAADEAGRRVNNVGQLR
ncbi:hypothetical protein WMY93_025635 [Mugilogobius chulae]|uniref:SAP domain-containing protein n=1 Tax=Mugilogobius chulae TaxID=88201 RepID=A0AAW0MWW9_9GOBI